MESTRRLYEAYKSDKYINDIYNRIKRFMEYSAVTFQNETPEEVRLYHQMIESYTKDQYPWLIETPKTDSCDLAIAMGYSLFVAKRQKILSTKRKSNLSVLDGIDIRLTLYLSYQKDWLNNTNFEILNLKDILFKMMYGIYHKPYMSFNEWLYIHGYETLLNDDEFIEVIEQMDKFYQNN